ncbi:MAG: Sua5/YciO/YrdC/YwlC family protein, partial [Cyanobium sp.]
MSGSGAPGARLRLVARGVVQGVGARPALRRLAQRLGLRGRLCNQAGELEADLCGARPQLEAFLAALPEALPAGARLEELSHQWLPSPRPVWPAWVRIAAAPAVPLGRALVAPGLAADRAPCGHCLAELDTPGDRRHRYPFISCCDCGPRFSLATALPFCRAHTTLAAFQPCPACAREFSDPADRRCHSETISCPACGPRLRLLNGAGEPLAEGEAALAGALDRLRAGDVLALQGVGGFQLLVAADQERAVERLRQRKRRPAKPLALLVHDPAQLGGEVWLSASEERLLRDPAAPIVLLRRQPCAAGALSDVATAVLPGGARGLVSGVATGLVPDVATGLVPGAVPGLASGVASGLAPGVASSLAPGIAYGVAPGAPSLGVMLPASPLHHLLVRAVGRPLVCTSGNRSGEPLCLDRREAEERLAGIADALLHHDRPIARRLDDSVLQLIDGRPSLLRRARGYAPHPLPLQPLPQSLGGSMAAAVQIALGSDLKSAPALAQDDTCWLAPHLGDVAEGATLQRLQSGTFHLASARQPALQAVQSDLRIKEHKGAVE